MVTVRFLYDIFLSALCFMADFCSAGLIKFYVNIIVSFSLTRSGNLHVITIQVTKICIIIMEDWCFYIAEIYIGGNSLMIYLLSVSVKSVSFVILRH